jgi:hypothetical protein
VRILNNIHERIETLKGGVKQAKDAIKPSGKERTLLKQYEILTAGNLEKLIKRKTCDDGGLLPIYYIRPLQESNITLIYHIGLLRY